MAVKLSILMTTYNESRNVKEVLNAILNQNFRNFELLIADDGSTDNTVEIIKNFIDDRIILFENSHTGRASNLNFILKKAQGEYLAINDADDIPINDRFTKQVNYLDNHPDIYMIGSQGIILYKNTGEKKDFNKPITHKEILDYLIIENPFIHSSIMFKKEIFQKVGYYAEKYTKFGIEYELWSRILPVYKTANLPERLIIYTIHKTNTFRRRNVFIKLKHQIIMRYLVFRRLKYPKYKFIYIFYKPVIFLIKDMARKVIQYFFN